VSLKNSQIIKANKSISHTTHRKAVALDVRIPAHSRVTRDQATVPSTRARLRTRPQGSAKRQIIEGPVSVAEAGKRHVQT